ncbi:hypothetical protein ACHQM5_022425 [Ranunculus cassubicifolius]
MLYPTNCPYIFFDRATKSLSLETRTLLDRLPKFLFFFYYPPLSINLKFIRTQQTPTANPISISPNFTDETFLVKHQHQWRE